MWSKLRHKNNGMPCNLIIQLSETETAVFDRRTTCKGKTCKTWQKGKAESRTSDLQADFEVGTSGSVLPDLGRLQQTNLQNERKSPAHTSAACAANAKHSYAETHFTMSSFFVIFFT